MNYFMVLFSISFWGCLIYFICTDDRETKEHPKLNKILDVLTYPIYIVTQIIVWGWLVYTINYYNLTIHQTVFYIFSGDLLLIAFICFGIIPNLLAIMALSEKDEVKTNIDKCL